MQDKDASKYADMNGIAFFGLLANAVEGGGNGGRTFPQDDAQDLKTGAQYIPSEVTSARREGKRVKFITSGLKKDWYWEMPDGQRIYHG